MIDAKATSPPDSGWELLDLIALLDATERRIEELTDGEVDSVIARDGRALLLSRAQEQVRLNEAATQAAILDALPARIALLDPQGMIISENETWRDDARRMRPVLEKGLSYLAMYDARAGANADHGQQIAGGIRSVLDGRAASFALEYLEQPLGHRSWCMTTVMPLAGSPPSGAVVMHVDTTARREAEEDLRETDARFRQLADNIDTVFFLRDASGDQVLYVSPAYEKIWGRSCESLYANPRSWGDSFHPEDREATQAAHVEAGVGGRFQLEVRVVRPDGSVRWISSRGFPVRDEAGLVVRVAGVAEDITERKQALERLRESESRYRTLTDASFDAITITQDGILLEVNPGFERIFGYSAAEAIGRHVTEWSAPESVDNLQHNLSAGANGTYQMVALRKNGERVFLEVTARPHTMGGKDVRIAALRDVTERRKLEEQFRQAQKMEAIGLLAGGVAHDFNNLLTVIGVNSSFLLESLSPDDPQRGDAEAIHEAGVRGAALTRQLLAFSRKQLLRPVITDLNAVVAESSKMLARLIGDEITIALSLANDLGRVTADPGQLDQVLMNLAVNARDAMPDGGRLAITTRNVTHLVGIEGAVRVIPPGEYVLLEVQDAGVGMDAQTRARIFEPFFTTKATGKGTGLGLATVYGIVKQSDGYVLVESAPGHGTTFSVYLPRSSSDESHEPQLAGAGPATRGTETVLVIEDEAAVREIATRVLKRLGYQVLEARDGFEALSLASTFAAPIHLVLSDASMPGISGGETFRRLRERRPGLKVVFMSGYTDDEVLRRGVVLSEVAFVEKPFEPAQLARVVRETLDR
jgi:two-component system cell cycle sensor histidine kinase/response regulator CckA